ncbi:unnamed protein product, partial [Mesorhabditis belari]|uniref:Homeobox domain-containing protein n=1 Tax=Mesorhabditis belari TaxID=2138241 RepID=A0AAF3JC49_9BILA
MDRVKFAVVRVPESKVIEFFAIIASKGFTDVAFVNSLQQAAFTSLADEPPLPSGGSPASHHSNAGLNGMTILQSSPSPPPAATVSTNNTTPLNLSDLFPAVLGQVANGRDVSPFGDAGLLHDEVEEGRGRPYHQRMKGWQRTYLSEMLKEGYPSDERLHEAMLKCDLSRRQILRFISKRVNNPNKGLRTDWRAAKAHDNEKMIGDETKEEILES